MNKSEHTKFILNKLPNSIIISSMNIPDSLEQIEYFAKDNLFNGSLHADYFLIKKNHDAKNISNTYLAGVPK